MFCPPSRPRDTARAMSQENVEIVRRLWSAAERGDDQAVYALYDSGIVWTSHAGSPLGMGGGTTYGHDGVRQFFRDWLESFELYYAKADEFVEAGDQVVVGYRVSGRGKASGMNVEMPRWNVYGIRNGLVAQVEIFDNKPEALEAAGLSE